MAVQERFVARPDHEVRELGRQKPSEPADPLKFRQLGRDAVFEITIPFGELGRLPLDRVVVSLDPYQRGNACEQFSLVKRFGDEVVGSRLDRPTFS